MTKETEQLTPVERLLTLFTEVRSGEGLTALLMTLNIFFIGTCYYILKPAREAFLSLDPSGALTATHASAAMAILLIPFVVAYSRLGQRVSRRKLVAGLTAFFVANLLIFYVIAGAAPAWLGFAFFVWLGIFNLSVISQFWTYGNDIYTPDQGKRLFPLILLGQNGGAILGPLLARQVVSVTGDTRFMLLMAAIILTVSIFLTLSVDARARKKSDSEEPESKLGPEGGFQLVFRYRYLMYIAALIMILNMVNTTGEFILRDTVFQAAAASEQQRDNYTAVYYSNFFLGVNILGILLQALAVSRILKFVGVRGAILIPPLLALAGYGAIGIIPLLTVITVYKTVENSVDYTLMNTLRAALYLPTSREVKYKAKQTIDTFFVRVGDVLSAGLVHVMAVWLGLGVPGFAAATLGAAILWLALALGIRREYAQLADAPQSDGLVTATG